MNVSVPVAFAFGVYVQAVALQVTVPSAPFVLPVIVSVLNSTSVSLLNTLIATGVSSVVVAVSFTATGGSLTGVTVIENETGEVVLTPPFAVPPLSCSVTLRFAMPFAFAAGVNVSAPAGVIEGCTLKRAALVLVMRNVSVWVDSLAGPAEIEVAHVAV